MVDHTWLEEYRKELHSLREAGDIKAIRRKNMELNNRVEYVKDETEKEIFLTALYETEDVLRECREEEKLRNGLAEYSIETLKTEAPRSPKEDRIKYMEDMLEKSDSKLLWKWERKNLSLPERFELESKLAEKGEVESLLWLANFYEERGNKLQRNSLLKRAADEGSSEAIKRLGDIYREGDGWDKDLALAHMYYNKAEKSGDDVAMRKNCLLFYEEERDDRVYPYVKTMLQQGMEFAPENNWEDACLLVVYTEKGIHYGELQRDLENLTEMRTMLQRVERERKTARTKQDVRILYRMECMYLEALFHLGRWNGACHSIPEVDWELYVMALLKVALDAGGKIQKEVWDELLGICKDAKESVRMRNALLVLMIDRLHVKGYIEEALYFADWGNLIFEDPKSKALTTQFKAKYGEVEKELKKKGEKEQFRCYDSIVKRGGINTAYRLGNCYYYGIGCERNFEKAKLYYELASQGGWCYECANTIRYCKDQLELKRALEVLKTDNFAEAVQTIKRLAVGPQLEIPEAQYEYGRLLEQGTYVKRDEKEAFFLYAYAAIRGHEQAKQCVSRMKKEHPEFWEMLKEDEKAEEFLRRDDWKCLEAL